MNQDKVAAFSISLDGFGAGPGQNLNSPLGVRGHELHSWLFPKETFQKMTGKSLTYINCSFVRWSQSRDASSL
jgi:hypothetical protein